MLPTAEIREVPAGDLGIGASISAIQSFADQAALDPKIIYLARRIVASVPDRDKVGQADALFWFVKDNIRFINDPLPAEMIQTPKITLQEGWGDCDDMVTLLAALNLSIGNEVGFITVSYPNSQDFVHIFLVLLDEKNEPRFYDPSLPESYPGFCVTNVGRVRLWFSSRDYKDLAGFFDKVNKFFKDLYDDTLGKVFKEIERAARRIKREVNRVARKITAEFARWERKLGPAGKFLVLGVKVLASVATGGLLAPSFGVGVSLGYATSLAATAGFVPNLIAGQLAFKTVEEAVNGVNPLVMTEEEWRFVANLALSLGSTILSLVSAGAATPLLVSSFMNLLSAGLSLWDLEDKKEQAKELKKKLEAEMAKVSLEARVQREAIAKLEKDILLIEELLNAQKAAESRMMERKLAHELEVGIIWEAIQQKLSSAYQEVQTYLSQHAKNLSNQIKQQVLSELSGYWIYLTQAEQLEIKTLIAGVTI